MIPARNNGKHPGGRPSKYDPSYCSRIEKFFRTRKNSRKLVTVLDFAESIHVGMTALDRWQKDYEEFGKSVKNAMRFQEYQLSKNGLRNQWNTAMSIFLLKNNHGYRDRQPDEGQQPTQVVQVFNYSALDTEKLFDRLSSRLAAPTTAPAAA